MMVPYIEYGLAAAAIPGETECGDQPVIKTVEDGIVVAALDGLGHGKDAARAAHAGAEALHMADEPTVISLFRRCHDALRGTRGLVMSLGWFNSLDDTITWLGVGNVRGRLLRASPDATGGDEELLLRPGLLGHQLPPLQAAIVSIVPGDTVVFATDGIGADFDESLLRGEAPQAMAERILTRHGKTTDDALVLVARYLGGH